MGDEVRLSHFGLVEAAKAFSGLMTWRTPIVSDFICGLAVRFSTVPVFLELLHLASGCVPFCYFSVRVFDWMDLYPKIWLELEFFGPTWPFFSIFPPGFLTCADLRIGLAFDVSPGMRHVEVFLGSGAVRPIFSRPILFGIGWELFPLMRVVSSDRLSKCPPPPGGTSGLYYPMSIVSRIMPRPECPWSLFHQSQPV